MAIHYRQPLDRTFHALGDESRRQMLARLAVEGACTAGELGGSLDFAQPTISKHIRVLEQAGLVQREIDGRVHRFRLNEAPLDEAQNWIQRHRRFWESTLDRLEAYVVNNDETKDDPAS